MAISRNNTITVSLFSTLKKKPKVLQSTPCIFTIPTKVDKKLSCISNIYWLFFCTEVLLADSQTYIRIKCVLSRYMCTYMYIYMYYTSLCSQKCKDRTNTVLIELNERPSFTPSNWHWTSINTQFTDHVTAFRRRCLLIIRCLSVYQLVTRMLCCGEHRGWLPSQGYPWRWPRITSQMCTLGWLACKWKTASRGQWSRAWERSYYSYRRHATSNFVLAIPLNSWSGSIVS